MIVREEVDRIRRTPRQRGAPSEPEARPAPAQDGPPPARAGLPVEPRRIVRAIGQARWTILSIAVAAALVGAVVGRFVLKKTYVATATLLWEPPAAAKSDPARELGTISASAKLPANLRTIRERLHANKTLEALAKSIDVTVAESSMLVTFTTKDNGRDESAAMANATIDVFLDAQKDVAKKRLEEIAVSLRKSLGGAETILTDARSRYDQFRKDKHIGDLSIEKQHAIESAARARASLDETKVALSDANAREAALKSSRDKAPSSVVTMRNEAHLDAAKLADLEVQLAQARAIHTDEHPIVIALQAQVRALKAQPAGAASAVTGESIGRSVVHDTLSLELAQSEALRKATQERQKALEALSRETDERAAKLTEVEGEAARMLADVQVAEHHVSELLKQLASAEDDVRGATSGFQIVSRAEAPEHSERGMGRVVAIAMPLVATLLTMLYISLRTILPLRAHTAREAAFFGKTRVLWSSGWPAMGAREAPALVREIAEKLEEQKTVVGITGMDADVPSELLTKMIATRLRLRGSTCAIVDLREGGPLGKRVSLADSLEHASTGQAIRKARARSSVVLVLLPTVEQAPELRVVRRWVDSLLVLVAAGRTPALDLAERIASTGWSQEATACVMLGVDEALLDAGPRMLPVVAEGVWPIGA